MDINAFWDAVLCQDAARMRGFFHEDAYVNWHNTNEHFTAEEFIRANCAYPGKWRGEVERCIPTPDGYVAAVHVYAPEGEPSFHAVSFIRMREDKIDAVDEYWGDDGMPPEWRQALRLGSKIK